MGCLPKHRRKQKSGSSLACSSGRGSLRAALHCHHCRFAGRHFSSWVELRPGKGSCCVGHCHGGSPRSQCSDNPSPELTQPRSDQQCMLLFQTAPFSQVSFCFVSISPSSLWKAECLGPQKFIYHTVFFALLARVGEHRSHPCPPPYCLSPWGHVVWEQQLP